MNRLVIIGNGFDLAHGLPTSYKHFLNDFWKNILKNVKDGKVENLLNISSSHLRMFENNSNSIQSFDCIETSLKNYGKNYDYIYDNKYKKLYRRTNSNKTIFEFKSDFFKAININNSKNWVDIEGEYYNQLKKIVKESKNSKVRIIETLKLHKEFDDIKELLKRYLDVEVNKPFLCNNSTLKLIDNLLIFFKIRHLDTESLKEYLNEFPKEDHEELTKFNECLKGNKRHYSNAEILTENKLEVTNFFVNFNYTKTITKYENKFNTEFDYHGIFDPINIHGELPKSNNKIIFGFGDEMDEDYSTIEKLDDNEYLKNFKSFQYSLNSNYKKLLDFIEANKFQVFIMGHSCGLSDRILLNTIFEHENCRSIKVFYRKKEGDTDNYTNLVQNISRHFNDKALMRKKLVNKLLCKPLVEKIV